ncbi:MAG: hypothetical protein ACYC5J_19715, partial [Chloroflexota bacterium]
QQFSAIPWLLPATCVGCRDPLLSALLASPDRAAGPTGVPSRRETQTIVAAASILEGRRWQTKKVRWGHPGRV